MSSPKTLSEQIIGNVVHRMSPLERNHLFSLFAGVGKDRFTEMFRAEMEEVSRREARAREKLHWEDIPLPKPNLADIVGKLTGDDRQNLLNLLREAKNMEQAETFLIGAIKRASENEKHGR